MKNKTYLKSIYDDIKALGIIDTPYDFSRLCGRTPAWYSCIKSRDLPLTADAALTLSISLRIKAEHVCEQEQQRKIVVSGNTGDITATRDASLANTEAGSGKSSLNSWAVGGELGWGMMVGNKMIATPYFGLRYSDVTRGSYTENTTTDVTSPLSYASFYQRATTATAGVRIAGMLSDAFGYQLGAGAEYDVGHSANHYSGTSAISGLETFSVNTNVTTNHFRPSASVGLSYAIDKNQKITTSASVKGQAYSSQPSVTTTAGYQISF